MNRKFLFPLLASLPIVAQLALAQEPGCDVQLTGANPQHFFAPYKLGATGAASDFWLTAGQKKSTNASLDKALGQKTAAADSTNLVGPLVLNCKTEDGKTFLSVYTAQNTGSDHVIFGPKDYVLDNGSSAKKGHLGLVIFRLNGELYVGGDGGNFKVSQFDVSGIAGTYELDVKNRKTSEASKLQVSFNFPCNGDTCKK